MIGYSQKQSRLKVNTDLGENVLIPYRLDYDDALAETFRLTVKCISEHFGLDASKIIGKSVDVLIQEEEEDGELVLNGIVAEMNDLGGDDSSFCYYELTLVPWLKLLDKSTHCRIFQNKSVIEIAKDIFHNHGFKAYDVAKLQQTHDKHDYKVQYSESDLTFVQRILRAEGIFFYFVHAKGKHTLTLIDDSTGFFKSQQNVLYHGKNDPSGPILKTIRITKTFETGKSSFSSYDYTNPECQLFVTKAIGGDLHANSSALKESEFESHLDHGSYVQRQQGENLNRYAIEHLRSESHTFTGETNSAFVRVGCTFKIASHAASLKDNNELKIIAIHSSFEDRAFLGQTSQGYACTFRGIPLKTPYRPQTIAKPTTLGIQTALVVGPKAEEIYTDKYARVKVQFNWDREAHKDEQSSCWIRVSQSLAGKSYGAFFLPRVGHEVIVGFINNDPDKPLILGALYNGTLDAPYAYPDFQTKSGFRSHTQGSTLASNEYNELSFEDKKGSEEVYLKAQKNYRVAVLNNQDSSIGANRTTSVEGDETKKIVKNLTMTVGNARKERVQNNYELKVGADHKIEIQQDMHLQIGAKRTTEISANDALTVNGQSSVESLGSQSYRSTTTIAIEGTLGITLTSGAASIQLTPDGSITIKGVNITIAGVNVSI